MLAPAKASDRSFEVLLAELEALLTNERDALKRLDRDAISASAETKLELDLALKSAPLPTPVSATLVAQMERVRRSAQVNQVLLAHARSCVQGMLQLITGRTASPVARPGSVAPPPVALNFRG
jgi:hypothetical protein